MPYLSRITLSEMIRVEESIESGKMINCEKHRSSLYANYYRIALRLPYYDILKAIYYNDVFNEFTNDELAMKLSIRYRVTQKQMLSRMNDVIRISRKKLKQIMQLIMNKHLELLNFYVKKNK